MAYEAALMEHQQRLPGCCGTWVCSPTPSCRVQRSRTRISGCVQPIWGIEMLEARDIHAFYGRSHVLQGVSLKVHAGELVCLLGRNGAGKTTTLRSLMGLTAPRRGSVRLQAEELVGQPPF